MLRKAEQRLVRHTVRPNFPQMIKKW